MSKNALLEKVETLPVISGLTGALEKAPSRFNLKLPPGSLRSLVYALLLKSLKRPFLLIVPSLSSAQTLRQELRFWLPAEQEGLLFPGLNVLPFEGLEPSIEVVGERLKVLAGMRSEDNFIVIAPIKALLFKTASSESLETNKTILRVGARIDREALIKKWVEQGYAHQDIVGEKGEFTLRGGIIDIFPSSREAPVRIELFGEQIESLRSFNPNSQRSFLRLNEIEILPAKEESVTGFLDELPLSTRVIFEEPVNIAKVCDRIGQEAKAFTAGQKAVCFDFDGIQRALSNFALLVSSRLSGFEQRFELAAEKPSLFHKNLDAFGEELRRLAASGYQITVISKHLSRIGEFIPPGAFAFNGGLNGGFILQEPKLALYTDVEIFGGVPLLRPKTPVLREGVNRDLLLKLRPGDYVVHENYGIGIYRGLETMEIGGSTGEYLLIEYQNKDKLHVPLHHMGLVQKFSSGGADYKPKIARLGGREWQRIKNKVQASIKDLTKDLLRLYALREKEKGFCYPKDDVFQRELSETFPYEETVDQEKAIAKVKQDLESGRPMDRLVCGDVGYGKTEVAIRAAVKVVSAGKQVAVVVPTTILAEQHFNTFKERLAAFPFRVAVLSRFLSAKEQKQIVEEVRQGRVDIVIGTHRLLQKDIGFRDLGLMVLDEEQKFGVLHKEKLKKIKGNVEVLTLTATPIPRTLYFSLSGIRDMSIINTPPVDRLPVRTYVAVWNETLIKEAILREIDRGGQVYFVHPYVASIYEVAKNLARLLPEINFGIAHGRLPEKQLEKTMVDFLDKKLEVLICSNIIESGLDMPNVNTIIVDQADRFGLSQLYQLRGRVGRSALRAYAYLLYRREAALTDSAVERLKTLQEYTALGSGYQIALKDLEIRGAGNLLGSQQSGHIMAVGFELYCDLLEEAVKEIKGIKEHAPREIAIDLKVDAYIPGGYIEDEKQRIATYRRMNRLAAEEEIEDLRGELKDRFGEIPLPLERLFQVLKIKSLAGKKNLKSIEGDKFNIRLEYWDGKIKTCRLPALSDQSWFSEIKNCLF